MDSVRLYTWKHSLGTESHERSECLGENSEKEESCALGVFQTELLSECVCTLSQAQGCEELTSAVANHVLLYCGRLVLVTEEHLIHVTRPNRRV